MIALTALTPAGCANDQGDELISAKQLRQIRQENIDLATELAAHVAPRPHSISESISQCSDGDRSAAYSTYHIGGRSSHEAVAYLRGDWTTRMKKAGWISRERAPVHDDEVDLVWTKPTVELFSVTAPKRGTAS